MRRGERSQARFWRTHWRSLLRTGLIVLLLVTVAILTVGRGVLADGRADGSVPGVTMWSADPPTR